MDIKKRWETDVFQIAPCITCIHKNPGKTCDAFSDGIPNEILNGSNQHTEKLPDQMNDIVYERST